ncbi:MAG: FABP family protein [bacterium]|nr:FABP family protein [bacterium]MCP5040466.1 FABP family protein [bacterium]
MANQEFGPLAALIGTWEGDQGLDVSYSYAKKAVIETPYRETATFNVVGDVTNGEQTLWVIDYTTAAIPIGEDEPFHKELGYWLWDPARGQVMRCFMVPRGSTILAGGNCAPDATHFEMVATQGDDAFGVLSNPYLIERARCSEYRLSCTIEDDVWSYEEDTVLEMAATGGTLHHTDKNTLRKVR